MNKFKLFGLISVAVSVMAFAPKAEAQVNITKLGTFLNTNVTVAAATTTTLATQTAVDVKQDSGIGVAVQISHTNAVGLTVTYNFAVSIDGTNYNNTGYLAAVVPFAGSTVHQRYYTNFPASALNNAKLIRLAQIVNAHTNAQVVTTNVQYYRIQTQ